MRLWIAVAFLIFGFWGWGQTAVDIFAWSQAHLNALIKEDLDGIMAAFHPEALVAFFGPLGSGLFAGDQISRAWSKFFQDYKIEEITITKVLPEARLVEGKGVLRQQDHVLRVFLQFTEDGKIKAADYLLVGANGVPVIDGVIREGEYAYAAEIAGAKVFWRNGTAVLFVGISTPGTGWLAVGFDPTGPMHVGANIIVAALTSNGLEIQDQFGFCCPPFHLPDERQDVLEAASATQEGWTTLEFAIPLDSGDEQDRPLRPGHTYQAILAYHRTSTDFRAKHTDRGTFTMELEGPTE